MKSRRARAAGTIEHSRAGTSESRNKPLRARERERERNRRSNRAGYGGYDLRGFARHGGERGPLLSAFSRTQSRQTYLNAHTSARARVCGDLARGYMPSRTCARAYWRPRKWKTPWCVGIREGSLIERLAFPLFSQQFLVPVRIIR